MDLTNLKRTRRRKPQPVDVVGDFVHDTDYMNKCAVLANVPPDFVQLAMCDFADYLEMLGKEETGFEMRKHFWNWFRVNMTFLVKQKHPQFASWVLP